MHFVTVFENENSNELLSNCHFSFWKKSKKWIAVGTVSVVVTMTSKYM